MDDFRRDARGRKPRGTHGMPASRPSVVNVPPQEQQLHVKLRSVEVPAAPATVESQPAIPDEPVLVVPQDELKQIDLEVKEVRYPRRGRVIKRTIIGSVIAFFALVLGIVVWYGIQLTPVDSDAKNRVAIAIETGSAPAVIAKKLKAENLIRSELVFLVQTRLQGVQGTLQAGTYRISPSESTLSVISHLVAGSQDRFDITFLPGATIAENKKVFLEAGYSRQEVDEAFAADYDSPIFAGKPKDADLEGYIYGDTYTFSMGISAKKVLEKVFAEFYTKVSENGLEKGYQRKGLTLYQGITLASIIQREAGGGDEQQISQVFLKRLEIGMPLGSDVTYQYIADKTGVPRDVNLDSPYNTRRYPGLPPGPIASPGYPALRAVSMPAEGDFLYFLSGDDDVTYFARTLEEHEANITAHCQKKCQII